MSRTHHHRPPSMRWTVEVECGSKTIVVTVASTSDAGARFRALEHLRQNKHPEVTLSDIRKVTPHR